ncbi:MAG: 4Fe-4S dicluster domain-containing protein [Atopobiaceae bacterium]|nr:4Fe-4S dicluster domain-containing protein [Atopobiaceae bacterium]
MRRVLEILRRSDAASQPHWQSFLYQTDDEQATVATALVELNEQDELHDVDGALAEPIMWENSCLQKKCGACAMVIDGVPRLACDTRLDSTRHERIRLEPLRKFPVVADLLVDRSVLMRNLAQAGTWLESAAELPAKRWDVAYEASRCLQCGCCLEVCPNFSVQNAFGGMAAMVPLARLLSEAPADQRRALAASYASAVYGGCGKSLACRNVCPANIDIDKLLSRSNAAAIWHRW